MSGFKYERGVKMSSFSDFLVFDMGMVFGKLFIAALLGVGKEKDVDGLQV